MGLWWQEGTGGAGVWAPAAPGPHPPHLPRLPSLDPSKEGKGRAPRRDPGQTAQLITLRG